MNRSELQEAMSEIVDKLEDLGLEEIAEDLWEIVTKLMTEGLD